MRTALISMLLFAAACGPRQVEVRSAPSQQAEVAIQFTNNLSKTVNVYVNAGQADQFVSQVGPNTTAHLPVPGIASGTRVTLKARPTDGSSAYERAGITLTEMTTWRIP